MSKYTVKLKFNREIAEGTMAFHFEKPEDFTFKAGQFGSLTLINPAETDAEGNIRERFRLPTHLTKAILFLRPACVIRHSSGY
jgi:hypothetical protein